MDCGKYFFEHYKRVCKEIREYSLKDCYHKQRFREELKENDGNPIQGWYSDILVGTKTGLFCGIHDTPIEDLIKEKKSYEKLYIKYKGFFTEDPVENVA